MAGGGWGGGGEMRNRWQLANLPQALLSFYRRTLGAGGAFEPPAFANPSAHVPSLLNSTLSATLPPRAGVPASEE
jgi:hypothetical protein